MTIRLIASILVTGIFFSCTPDSKNNEQKNGAVKKDSASVAIPCVCPKAYANGSRILEFKNGKKFNLCGAPEVRGADTIFSEFTLINCEKNKEVESWDGTVSAKVNFANDTLKVTQIISLPGGKNFEMIPVSFYTDRFFTREEGLGNDLVIENSIPKYSESQNKIVHADYKKARSLYPESARPYVHALPGKLLMAAISGDEEMGNILENFEKEFGKQDGAVAEELKDYQALYKIYKITAPAKK